LNVWTFSGRVGADAEVRSTQNGEQVVSFRVANDVGFGDRRTTQWCDCSYWGKRAAAVAPYIKKGMKVTVSGELKLEDFQKRDGTPGTKLAVRVNDLDLPSKAESEGGGNGGGSGGDRDFTKPEYRANPSSGYGNAGGGNQRGSQGGGQPPVDLDDEIPF
jgi:single-strand DNA-binding protein